MVKIISLNLWWGGHLFPAILDFLKTEDADILLLQEVYNGKGKGLKDRQKSVEILQATFAFPYSDFVRALNIQTPQGKLPLGNVILSKFPITNQSSRFLFEPTQDEYRDIAEHWPIFPRLLQHTQLQTPDGSFNVFNMHGVWDIDGDNYSEDRRQMSEIIIAEIADKSNVVLAGDTNAKPTNPAMRNIEKHLKSVFGNGLKTTFNMRRKDNPGYATAAVDLMYVSPNIEVLSKDCPDVDISDHLPLVVTLQLT